MPDSDRCPSGRRVFPVAVVMLAALLLAVPACEQRAEEAADAPEPRPEARAAASDRDVRDAGNADPDPDPAPAPEAEAEAEAEAKAEAGAGAEAEAEAEATKTVETEPASDADRVIEVLPPTDATRVRFELNRLGLRSLKVQGLGHDEHEYIHQDKDYQGDGRGDFKGLVRYRKPDGTQYRLDYWPGTKRKIAMDTDQGVLTWRLFDDQGVEAGAFEVRYRAEGPTMHFDVKYTHRHPTDRAYEIGAGLATLQLPQAIARKWNEISNCSVIDFGAGQLVAMSMRPAPGFRAGLQNQSRGVGFGMGFTGDSVQALNPGESVSASMELHFLPADLDPMLVADRAYEAWRERFPFAMPWDDHRPIGALFMARPHMDWKTNPNGYFNDAEVDVTTEQGLAAFRKRLLELAERTAQIANDTDAQGVIVWDLEGARHGHPTTYIGDPRQLDAVAPEMQWRPDPDAKPTADAFFEVFDKAGLKTGLTVRPQRFIPGDERSPA